MALNTGSRLGSYEIVSLLGAGGMGEVYRASDTKLGRDVALKILPEAFAGDADRLARFRREANVLASLNHPHIAAIYGLEDAPAGGAPAFLVMELVDGEDLSARIGRGAMPIDEALAVGTQIAEALEAAHDAGVIHRDLKPANVKVRPDGNVKVLDFGLAKAMDDRDRSGQVQHLTMSPTMTSPAQMTGMGVVLGTAAYMSPEQAKGRPVDKRADVWAFGAVLYEMLTGRRLFEGDDVSETFAAILRAVPDWNTLPANTPPAIRRLLRRCLEKDVRVRLSDMAMVAIELREGEHELMNPVSSAPTATRPPSSVFRRTLPYAVGIFLAAATGATTWWLSRPAEEPRAVGRFYFDLPDNIQLSAPARLQVAISPDGSRMVFVANQRLYVRTLDQVSPVAIAGTEAGGAAGFARTPFFSPDGQWIGFWQSGQLRKVAVAGGAPVTITDVPLPPVGISWEAGDDVLLGTGGDGIFHVKATGGAPEALITAKNGDRVLYPSLLPGGEWVMFMLYPRTASVEDGQVVAQSRTSGERRVLVNGVNSVRYVATGHLIYGHGSALLAQPIDIPHMTMTGGPVPLLDGVAGVSNAPGRQFALSSTGTLFYVPGTSSATSATKLVLVSRSGERSVLSDIAGMTWFPRFSPDGSRVAYGVSSGPELGPTDADLWVTDVARGARTRVTFSGNNRFYPIWTRDGLRLTFADGSTETNRILSAPADGSGGTKTLLDLGPRRFPSSWSPDGQVLALYGSKDASTLNRDLWMLRVDTEKPVPTAFVATPFEERGAIFSPDGKWVAYVSDKSGQNDIYARPFPGPGGEVTISVGGGQEPVWSPAGRELFYRHDGKLFVVRIDETASSLTVGTPARLFDDSYRPDTGGASGGMANYDVAPDGKRLVMVEEPRVGNGTSSEPVRLHVVLNWLDELKQRVPIR